MWVTLSDGFPTLISALSVCVGINRHKRQDVFGCIRGIRHAPQAAGSHKVFVVDEVDRSLHTLLTRRLLEAYLASCSAESRSQLLFTTHDVLLMDQHLLRRDEMWVAERKSYGAVPGASSLVSFAQYKDVRYDKDIRKRYLQGRLGGVPRILLGGHFAGTGQAMVDDSP